MGDPYNYGRGFWGVIEADGKGVAIHAAELRVLPDGSLVALGGFMKKHEEPGVMMGWAPGQWLRFMAASHLSGSPVLVDHEWDDGNRYPSHADDPMLEYREISSDFDMTSRPGEQAADFFVRHMDEIHAAKDAKRQVSRGGS